MRKILFVTFTGSQVINGGQQCSKRNLHTVELIFGEQNVKTYSIAQYRCKSSFKSVLLKIRDRMLGFIGMNMKHKREILDLVKDGFTDVFLDTSLLGRMAKEIHRKNPAVRIYTFFHNHEFLFAKSSIMANRDYHKIYNLFLVYYNEKFACDYSTEIITLNERDTIAVRNMYNRKSRYVIPITLKSDYSPSDSVKRSRNEHRNALFVGSYFYGNVEGLKWFCRNVLPKVDISLTVVGAGMETIKGDLGDLPEKKMRIFSYVPDLAPFYEDADYMVLPIISGSGMKVKTAEALSYGKFIIGTDESLSGYDVSPDIAVSCNSIDDFIAAIKGFNQEYKYMAASRELFERKYSFEASLSLFKEVFIVR